MISGLASLHVVGRRADALSEGVSFRTEGVGLCLCRRGRGVVVVDDVCYEVSAGSLGVFFPRSSVVVVERSEDLDALVIRVDVSATQPLLNRMGDVGRLLSLREHPLSVVGVADFAMAEGYVEGILRLQHQEEIAIAEGRMREAQLWAMQGERLRDAVALLVMLLLEASPDKEVVSPLAGAKRRSEVVSAFLEHLHQHFRYEHEVAFYAELQCLSARYFSWIVRERTGRTPSQWIASFLLEEARWLLSGTALSVKQIAEQLCFPSQSYFGKWFKHRMGVGPTQWRRKPSVSSPPQPPPIGGEAKPVGFPLGTPSPIGKGRRGTAGGGLLLSLLLWLMLSIVPVGVQAQLSHAWSLRYVSIDSVLRAVGDDESDEALCLKGFAKAMSADYAGAAEAYERVLAEARSALPRMEAQVGMMRVCQRRGENKRFYDYYAAAQESARRLQGAIGLMDEDEQRRWQTVQTDLHMLLCVYFYYQRQEGEAEGEYAWLQTRMHLLEGDTAQLAYFYFLRGNRKGQESMADLQMAADLAEQVGAVYVWAKAVGSMVESEKLKVKSEKLPCGLPVQALPPIGGSQRGAGISLHSIALAAQRGYAMKGEKLSCGGGLAQRVRRAFEEYGSPFDVSQTWLLEGRLWLDVNADSALYCMEQAWSLLPEGEACPEWRADVHEGLCMAYSALGMKAESDIHRNHYLDILDSTRQDHRMAQRVEALEAEERAVGRGLWMVAIGAVLLMAGLMWMVRRLRQRQAAHYAAELASLEEAMEALQGRSDESALALSAYGERVDAMRRESEQRAAQQQREWVDKQTCLSIVGSITPLIDRMLHAIGREERKPHPRPLSQGEGREEPCWQRTYIRELSERIIVLNEVLTRWISLRRGMVGLRIETFALQPLMDILAKSRGQFERAGIELSVEATDIWVKADRALTLFMLNTLLDNARKFTAAGGRVSVEIRDKSEEARGEGVVELSVEDTGGGEGGSNGEGHGFGLMNCKGIIEQYRKTSRRFSCCSMGHEQRAEGGSRYWFRLPRAGNRKNELPCVGLPEGALPPISPPIGGAGGGMGSQRGLLLALFLLLLSLPMHAQDWRTITDAPAGDSLPQPIVYAEADSLLAMADSCAWIAYEANLAGHYEQALMAVDEACQLIRQHAGTPGETMTEIGWWEAGIRTDYHLLLDLHNEAAIAALALKDWEAYARHNELYTRLYKLMAQDVTLEDYCHRIAQRAADKRVLLLLFSTLALLALLAYYTLYYRNHILMVFNMRQLLETCQRLTDEPSTERLAGIIAEGISAIRPTDGVALLTEGEPPRFSARCPAQDYVSHCLSRCMQTGETIIEGRVHTLPLMLKEKGQDTTHEPQSQRIGALCFVLRQPPTDSRQSNELHSLLTLLSKHAATAIYYSSVRSEQLCTDIALREDEQHRAQREAETLHVRNAIVDNALSALKHETMYYPTRIQQLATRPDCEPQQLKELATYYRDIFTTLSSCALHALGKPMLRRQQIGIKQMSQWMEQEIVRQGVAVEAIHTPGNGDSTLVKEDTLLADATLLQYLAQCLAQWMATTASEKTSTLTCTQSEKFVMFALAFPAEPWTERALHEAFFPESLIADNNNAQHALLIAKQIIRLHDEHMRRGCRISLAQADNSLTLSFSLPAC